MAEALRHRGMLRSRAIESAFRAVPRERFHPDLPLEDVYGDTAIVTRWRDDMPIVSGTQPSVLAAQLEALQARAGHTVLHIGTGTGYSAALLAEIVRSSGRVVSFELDQVAVVTARARLREAGYGGVEVIEGDGLRGWLPGAPYDRILVTASATRVSSHWIEQLAPGGILVVPLRIRAACFSVAFEREPVMTGALRSRAVLPVSCAPLRDPAPKLPKDEPIRPLGPYLYLAGEGLDDRALALVTRLLDETPRRVGDVRVEVNEYGLGGGLAFYLAMREGGFVETVATDPSRWGFHAMAGVLDVDAGGLCLIRPDAVVVYGAEAAADRLRAHAAAWAEMGQPGLDRARVVWRPRTEREIFGIRPGHWKPGEPAAVERLSRGDSVLQMVLERRGLGTREPEPEPNAP